MRCAIPAVLIPVIVALSGCAGADKPSPFTGFYKNYSGCAADYAAMDARVDAADVRDGAYSRVAGFPYLRTDRMLASFRHEVKGLEDISEWTRRMRELDQEARDFEYINLGMPEFERAVQRDRFLNCGRILLNIALEDPANWARLIEAVPPADAYSGLARVFGLYALMASSMNARVAQAHSAAIREYEQPLRDPAGGATLRAWTAKPKEDLSMIGGAQAKVLINALGFPGLFGSQWRALAERHAPALWIETAGEGDLPAAPRFGAEGLTADVSRPVAHYWIGYSRFGGDTLVQINYFFWFKSDPGAATGPIDGMIWRVTLDPKLRPLVYESLHASGRDHRWYPVQPLALRAHDDALQEPAFVAPELAPATAATLRLRAGSHVLRRVVPAEQASASPRGEYELRLYEELYTLPRPDGSTRSLFGPDGLVTGSHGIDPVSGFSSGILRPGVLRQYGHHAIAHVGRRHFDDPYLLESTFELPSKVEIEQASAARSN
ncbi:MAG: hypothetical protein ACT4PZ_14375 [Panacagrimonas sp.]